VLDLAVAWGATIIFGLPLWLSAIVGFVVAAMANYLLHEFWTFRSPKNRPSSLRAIRYTLVLAGTLVVRIIVVAILAEIAGDSHALLVLMAGASVSFCVHYLVSKHLVFQKIETKDPSQ